MKLMTTSLDWEVLLKKTFASVFIFYLENCLYKINFKSINIFLILFQYYSRKHTRKDNKNAIFVHKTKVALSSWQVLNLFLFSNPSLYLLSRFKFIINSLWHQHITSADVKANLEKLYNDKHIMCVWNFFIFIAEQ